MKSLIYKIRLILAGILISAAVPALSQIGPGPGISSPPTSSTPEFELVTIDTAAGNDPSLIFETGGTEFFRFRLTTGNNLQLMRGAVGANSVFSIADTTGFFTINSGVALSSTLALDGDFQSNLTMNTGGIPRIIQEIAGSGIFRQIRDADVSNATRWTWVYEADDDITLRRATGAAGAEVFADVMRFDNASGSITTSGNIFSHSGASPRFRFTETDANVDEGVWDLLANGNVFELRVLNDAISVASAWMTVSRTGTTIDAINLRATDIQHNGVNLSAASGSFVADTIGCGTEITGITIAYERVGNLVHVTIEEPLTSTCTSDSTSFTIDASVNAPSWWTGITAETGFNPLGGRMVDNGAGVTTLCAQVLASGDISLSDCSATASWTASGAKGFTIGFSYSFTFTLN